MQETGPTVTPSPIARLWQALARPSAKRSLGALLVVGSVIGASLTLAGGWAFQVTESNAFCLSCHEMKAFVLPAHEKSVHFANRTGVRATCADCHVPQEMGPRLLHKAHLLQEIWWNWQGAIATQERYDAKRLQLAQRVWTAMEASGSRECKTCHSHAAMAAHEQSPEAAAMMKWAQADGTRTCISCHKGVAHQLPEDWPLQ